MRDTPTVCTRCGGLRESERDVFNDRGMYRIMERLQIVAYLLAESERLDDPAIYAAAERVANLAHKVKR